MKRIGILGGSFNPVHNGHINIAEEFCKRLTLDKVMLIPVLSPPHKDDSGLLPGAVRFEMCRLACEGHDRLEVSDIELARGGKSYTSDTVDILKRQYPEAELYLITGADMFVTFETWQGFGRIVSKAVLCAAARHKGELDSLNKYASRLEKDWGARCCVESIPVRDISSTHIRRLLSEGGNTSGLLPDKVREYIDLHGLYKD